MGTRLTCQILTLSFPTFRQKLLEILNTGGFAPPIIVFVNQKKTADMVARDISRGGVSIHFLPVSSRAQSFPVFHQWSTAILHSGKNQEAREKALEDLRTGTASVLVATDLAGRGIDVQDVSLVINYQMANTIEAYVHRIGKFHSLCQVVIPPNAYTSP